MYCFKCDKEVKTKREEIKNEYQINRENVIVLENIYKCPFCHKVLMEEIVDEPMKKVYDKYLSNHQLKVEDFKRIRKELNLSQELFSKALGWSKKTINRYENGQTIPQKEYLVVYQKLCQNKDEFINILNYNKKMLGDYYYTILRKLSTNINLKTINTILYLLDKKALFETQIVISLFIMDFMYYRDKNKPITDLKYIKTDGIITLDNKDELINLLIKNNYLKIMLCADEKVKFTSNQNCDLKLFDESELMVMKNIKSKLKNKKTEELLKWSTSFIDSIQMKNKKIIDYKLAKEFDLGNEW